MEKSFSVSFSCPHSFVDDVHRSPRITAERRGGQSRAVHEIRLGIIFPGVANGDGCLDVR